MSIRHPAVRRVASAVLTSRKYGGLKSETICDIFREAERSAGSPRRAVRNARERLHKAWAAFLWERKPLLPFEELERYIRGGDDGDVRRLCREIMTLHHSSRERLAYLEEHYERIFAMTGRPKSLLDIACCFNPFAWRWMGLPVECRIIAMDNDVYVTGSVGRYLELEGVKASVIHTDAVLHPPGEPVDTAFLFKMYHCLEKRRKGSALDLVGKIKARHVVLTLPLRNLDGRPVDIYGNYRHDLEMEASREGWELTTDDIGGCERIIVIRKE